MALKIKEFVHACFFGDCDEVYFMLLELIKYGDGDFFSGSFHHFPSVNQIIDSIRCIELVINTFLDLIEFYLLFFPLEPIDLVIDLQLKGLHVLLFHN